MKGIQIQKGCLGNGLSVDFKSAILSIKPLLRFYKSDLLITNPFAYCKRGYFRWGKISRKWWQDISHGGNFHDTTSISFIKAYGIYFRAGVIFSKETKARKTQKISPRENFSVYSIQWSIKDGKCNIASVLVAKCFKAPGLKARGDWFNSQQIHIHTPSEVRGYTGFALSLRPSVRRSVSVDAWLYKMVQSHNCFPFHH